VDRSTNRLVYQEFVKTTRGYRTIEARSCHQQYTITRTGSCLGPVFR